MKKSRKKKQIKNIYREKERIECDCHYKFFEGTVLHGWKRV